MIFKKAIAKENFFKKIIITMSQLQALIFDVDGTLANTERDGHRVAFNSAFVEAGLDWHWTIDFYEQLLAIAGGKERIKFYLNQYQPEFKTNKDINEFIAHLHQLKTKHYQQLLQKGAISLRPGVKRLIEEAKKENIRLAIATTTSLSNVIALLSQFLALDWFEIIAAGDIVPAKKPAPDIYNYVLKRMNLLPENCLVFEDSDNGLLAAIQAGIKTIVTVNNYTKKQDFNQAILVLSDLGESEKPFKIIQGNLSNNNYVDLDSLRSLIANG
jgi:HAD superfamily hydrolase (TIGR01509 family)